METLERRYAELMQAIEEARRRKPPTLSGQTYPVARDGRVQLVDCVHVEGALQDACPRGLSCLYRHLNVILVDAGDLGAACGHFGLRGVLREITREEVAEEVRARRERGDEPSTGYLPPGLGWRFSREEADARIAIVRRRIAGTKATDAHAPAAQRRYPAATLP